MKTYLSDYLNYSKQSLERLDLDLLSKVIESLIQLKKREGRLFIFIDDVTSISLIMIMINRH